MAIVIYIVLTIMYILIGMYVAKLEKKWHKESDFYFSALDYIMVIILWPFIVLIRKEL